MIGNKTFYQNAMENEHEKNVVNHKKNNNKNYVKNLDFTKKDDLNQYLELYLPKFCENYELLEHIGNGSTGYVYKGKIKNHKTNQLFSFKFCLNKRDKKSNYHEIINQKNLHHISINEIYAFIKIDNNNFFSISALGKYGDLDNFLKAFLKRAILSETFINYLAKPILEALNHMHKFKLVHMDIKKGNIILDSELNPKLIDFSSTVSFEKSKPNETIKLPLIGTGRYMAPEILNEKEIEIKYAEKIDVYSLGVTLYNLTFGCYPYDLNKAKGNDYEKIKQKVNNNNLIFPTGFYISDKYKNFLTNILEKDYKKRYNIKEALEDPWIKGWDIINEEKENIGILENFIIELISDNIREFNIYIK